MFKLLDKIGAWNPQLLREINGRVKLFPVVITAMVSLVVQLLVYLIQLGQLPSKNTLIGDKYCGLGKSYTEQLWDLMKVSEKLQNSFAYYTSKANFDAEKIEQIRTQILQVKDRRIHLENALGKQCPRSQFDLVHWWRDHTEYMFQSLNVIIILTLLVGGTYLIIHNLSQEERRSTLNFIRVSPQNTTSILIGKILGVPILVYWCVALAIPFHIWSGSVAGIAFSHILTYYIVLTSACIFFFSAALLFALFTPFLNVFQPWLGAGTVLIFLFMTLFDVQYAGSLNTSAIWFRFFSPFDITAYLPNFIKVYNRMEIMEARRYEQLQYEQLEFFYIPIGANLFSFVGVYLTNYAIWTYGIWQGIKRCFRSKSAPRITKLQSYWLVAGVQILLWGFTLQNKPDVKLVPISNYFDINFQIQRNFPLLILFNLVLIFGLIYILSPERQIIQDWLRYPNQRNSSKGKWQSLLRDLIVGEKSPAIIAIALNLLIIAIPIVIWMILAPTNIPYLNSASWVTTATDRLKVILSTGIFITMNLICAVIAQILLLFTTPLRRFWAFWVVADVMCLPKIVLQRLNINPIENPSAWLISSYPWSGLLQASLPAIFTVFVCEVAATLLLNVYLIHKIRNL